MREWQVKRRERTRQLIELGGLVVKAGLVELADDDRATLYGAFLTVAAKLRGEEREQALVLWKRKGQRAFEMTAFRRHGTGWRMRWPLTRRSKRAGVRRF
jgi:hypothetical protein